jgi:hypothetical protein
MKNWLLIALTFFACFVVSAAIVAVSLPVLLGRLMHCAMSLGCSGVPSSTAEKLAPFGMLLPFIIFPAGTFLAQKPLRQTSLGKPARLVLSLAFALFPLAVYVATPLIIMGANKVSEIRSKPEQARLEEFERQLKSAPVTVTVRRARFLSEFDGGGILELTTEVKGVPSFLKYYELNIYDLDEEGGVFVDNDYSPGKYESSCKVINEGGKWEFRGYHLGGSLTSAEDTFTTRIRYLKERGYAGGAPRRIRFRLGVWAREDKAYRRDCIFFYDWVPLP